MITIFKKALIDDQYTKTLELFDVLLDNEEQQVNKLKIIETLGISEYLLSNEYKNLIALLAECFNESSYELYEDKDYISLLSKYGLSKNEFIEFLLRKSHKYNMFIQIGMKKFTINDYANEYYISSSKVYKELGKLKGSLAEHDISINKHNEFVGDELKIRKLIMSIYYVSQSDFTVHYRRELIDIIKKYYGQDVPFNFVNALFVYFEIIQYRKNYSNKENINLDKLPSDAHCRELSHDLGVFLSKITRVSHEATMIESRILATFIYGNYGEISDANLPENFPKTIVDELMSDFEQTGINLPTVRLMALKNDINRVVYKALHPLSPSFDSYVGRNIFYFEEMFPEFFYFLQNHISLTNNKFYEDKKHYMFYNYMLSLIEYVDIVEYFEDIVICIDFREDINYYLMIKNNVESISNLNVIVTSEFNRDVDLVITDTP